jgi:hypothetical protein
VLGVVSAVAMNYTVHITITMNLTLEEKPEVCSVHCYCSSLGFLQNYLL